MNQGTVAENRVKVMGGGQMTAEDRRTGRRDFLKAGVAAGFALGAGSAGPSACARTPASKTYHEPAREVPIVDEADVVVCGAGPAGVSAAVMAARAGAKTWLLETSGCLGGVWTAGLLSWILDVDNKTGLMSEILQRLGRRGAQMYYPEYGQSRSAAYQVEAMKVVLEQMCVATGAKILLHNRVVAAVRDAGGRLALAVTESKSGRQAIAGKIFIDATGDGDLAAQAGCKFDYGRQRTGQAQPMSMLAILVGLDPEKVAAFVRGLAEPRGEKNPKRRLLEEMRRAGVTPSYSQPTLFYLGDGLFCLMANHEYGVSAMDAIGITQATMRGRAEVHQLVDALRALGDPWKGVRIAATSEHIGVREGRRIGGLYQVTQDDLARGAEHDDAVCRVTFPVDVHSTDPSKDKGISRESVRAKPYDIPYRALVARDVKGLLLAGRCISGDFIAHSSYRVTGNAVAMGEAAGVAAAVAAHSSRLPHEVPWAEVREARGRLREHGPRLEKSPQGKPD
jgi:hypothetical protein